MMLGTLFFVYPSLTAMVGISYKHYIFVILPNENRDNKQKNNSKMDQTVTMTHIIQGILNIVKYYFKIELPEDSLDYDRFLTHLRFFAQRIVRGRLYTTDDPAFCEMIRNQYPEEYRCVGKIREYISREYRHEMTEEEMMYLTVHIRRLVKQGGER